MPKEAASQGGSQPFDMKDLEAQPEFIEFLKHHDNFESITLPSLDQQKKGETGQDLAE